VGLLLKDMELEIQVNHDIVKHEMEFLQAFAMIAFFMRATLHRGPK
jgi:hypothetical protein